ncbi:MAG TPA: hypothetical protein PKY82_35215, partial [Pyrinomonadaceae bacterium]|nr:hypothetical protein [Pyrinomonadaceae bacterium]
MKYTEQQLESLLAKGHCKLVSGSGVFISPKNTNRSRSGFRADLQLFVRSAWEGNYARYLNWLVQNKQITRWEYETEEFELFRTIRGKRVEYKRGNRFYK